MITRKDITTGISSDDYIEVTDGIEADEQVIRDIGSCRKECLHRPWMPVRKALMEQMLFLPMQKMWLQKQKKVLDGWSV